jgi:hypothetical protein
MMEKSMTKLGCHNVQQKRKYFFYQVRDLAKFKAWLPNEFHSLYPDPQKLDDGEDEDDDQEDEDDDDQDEDDEDDGEKQSQ